MDVMPRSGRRCSTTTGSKRSTPNGYDSVIIVYSEGTNERVVPIATSDQDLIEHLRNWAASGAPERRFYRTERELAMKLPNGERLHPLMDVTRRPVTEHPQPLPTGRAGRS